AGYPAPAPGRRSSRTAACRSALPRVLHEPRQFTRLVQLERDVAAADELAVHEQLRERRPIGKTRQVRADLRIFEHVDRMVFRVDRLQDLRRATGEAAHRELRRSLHEQHDGVALHRLPDTFDDIHDDALTMWGALRRLHHSTSAATG